MGCGIFWRQFSALVRKNALTKRRSKLQLVREGWWVGFALSVRVDQHSGASRFQMNPVRK